MFAPSGSSLACHKAVSASCKGHAKSLQHGMLSQERPFPQSLEKVGRKVGGRGCGRWKGCKEEAIESWEGVGIGIAKILTTFLGLILRCGST